MPIHRSTKLIIALAVPALACGALLAAGKTVPGERWSHKMTMKMGGMSMPVPGGEVCAPVGQAAAELAKPDKNCTLSNVSQSGNRFSADVKCTGKDALEGTMDITTGPDVITGKMRMKSSEGEMTLDMESRKLGACEAIDTGAAVAAANAAGAKASAAVATEMAKVCAGESYDLKASPEKVSAVDTSFLRPGSYCSGKPLPPSFCPAVQSRPGFSELSQYEKVAPGALDRSLSACKLGSGKAAADSLRARLVASAEADGDGDFLVANAPGRAKALARSQCVVKGEMWGGKDAKWDNFCDSNFAAETRGGN